jgi:hypothetical protein
LVRNSSVGELELFDADALIDAMRQHSLGVGNAMAGGKINATLAVIAWSDRLPASRGMWARPTETHRLPAQSPAAWETRPPSV